VIDGAEPAAPPRPGQNLLIAQPTALQHAHEVILPYPICLIGGLGGIALWIPFDDAPPYLPVRAWLHAVAREAERRRPMLFSVERPLAERGDRVHIAVESNAPGRWSALPYSLRGFDGLPMVTPIRWEELDTTWGDDINGFNSAERSRASANSRRRNASAWATAASRLPAPDQVQPPRRSSSQSTSRCAAASSRPRSRSSRTASRATPTSCWPRRCAAALSRARRRVSTSTPR
jgi:hypothetical protein